MFGSNHPHPPHEHHIPPHPVYPPHHHPPRPDANNHSESPWRPPLPTERDRELLTELLGTEEEAQALLQTIQAASPATAAIGYLMLRVLEQTHAS
jgi:hypothetical protein